MTGLPRRAAALVHRILIGTAIMLVLVVNLILMPAIMLEGWAGAYAALPPLGWSILVVGLVVFALILRALIAEEPAVLRRDGDPLWRGWRQLLHLLGALGTTLLTGGVVALATSFALATIRFSGSYEEDFGATTVAPPDPLQEITFAVQIGMLLAGLIAAGTAIVIAATLHRRRRALRDALRDTRIARAGLGPSSREVVYSSHYPDLDAALWVVRYSVWRRRRPVLDVLWRSAVVVVCLGLITMSGGIGGHLTDILVIVLIGLMAPFAVFVGTLIAAQPLSVLPTSGEVPLAVILIQLAAWWLVYLVWEHLAQRPLSAAQLARIAGDPGDGGGFPLPDPRPLRAPSGAPPPPP